jgi:hypothetical protein
MGRFRSATSSGNKDQTGAANKQPVALTALPPNIIVNIISFLPVPDLTTVASACRRLKIISYNDEIYIPKLLCLGLLNVPNSSQEEGAGTGNNSSTMSKLSTRLKQLPGGNMLPTNSKYLETGTLWTGLTATENSPTTTSNEGTAEVKTSQESVSLETENPSNKTTIEISTVEASSPSSPETIGNNSVNLENELSPARSEALSTYSSDSHTTAFSNNGPTPEDKTQKITGLPTQITKSTIVIGAGGLKSANKESVGGIGALSSSNKRLLNLNGMKAREVFRKVYSDLLPYYQDFSTRQKDSKVFKDYKELSEIAIVLKRLVLFSKSKFLTDKDDLNFSLETTCEWYESMLLGQFDRAYDTKNIQEMRKNAAALYELNGGSAVVQLFISKNPIFFDENLNPCLVASNLAFGPEPRGYTLADDFAKFTDTILNSCKEQAHLVSRVFPPEMNAMTLFVSKVFEESVTEYLSAILKAAKEFETVEVYLHTFATAVHCCSQFLEFISNAVPGVMVHTAKIRNNIAGIFKPYYDKYLPMELEHMMKRFDTELTKWKTRVSVFLFYFKFKKLLLKLIPTSKIG